MRALVGVAFAGFVLGLAALALVLTGDHETVSGPFVVLALTLGWSFIGTGVYARWRRPDSPIGRLMILTSWWWAVPRPSLRTTWRLFAGDGSSTTKRTSPTPKSRN